MGNFNSATSVFVDGKDIYVTITEPEQNRALLWKNGKSELLGNQEANSVAVKDGKVYVVGKNDDKPTLWINGAPSYLSDNEGSAESICLNGEDIYIAGYIGDYSFSQATIWKNGIKESLSENRSRAQDVIIDGDNIYVAGEENENATLWINGKSKTLSFNKSSAYSVAVFDRTVYVTGIKGFNKKGSPIYGIWKDGVLQNVSDEMRDQISSVKIFKDKVYFSGSSKKKKPLWTIKFNQ